MYAVKNLTKRQHQQNLVYRSPYGRGISSDTYVCVKDTGPRSNRNIWKILLHPCRGEKCLPYQVLASMYVKVKKLSVVRPLGAKCMSKHF